MIEISKIVDGFPNYAVNTLGQVINVKYEKIIKGYKMVTGYMAVTLCNTTNKKPFLVHRLVALAFIPNPQRLPFVDHIDENKSNNCVANLRWCTRRQNTQNITATKRRDQLPVGVYRSGMKFCARITVDGKSKHLGTYPTIEEAEFGRLNEERKHFKEFQPASRMKRLIELEKKYDYVRGWKVVTK